MSGFEWNDTDLSSSTYGLTLARMPIPYAAEAIYSTIEAALGRGTSKATNFAPVAFDLECIIDGTSLSDVTSKIELIKKLMHPFEGAGKFEIPSFADRYWLIDEVAGFTGDAYQAAARLALRLIARDPHAFATSMTEDSFSIDASPKTLNTSSVPGSTHCDAVYYIRNSTGGTYNDTITITNETYSNFFKVKPSMPDGRWLKIGSHDSLGRYRNTLEMSTASGADPEALTYSSIVSTFINGDWPRLKHGEANELTVTAAALATSAMEVHYRGRYL